MRLGQVLIRLRFGLLYGFAGVAFVVAQTTEPALRLGMAIICFGEALRFWASGYVGRVKGDGAQRLRDRGNKQLVTVGPYAFVRHPQHLGTLLIMVGFCLIVGNLWFAVAALGCFFVVYHHIIIQEEGNLCEELGTPYIVYRASVPRLMPAWKCFPNPQGQWSWRRLIRSEEWKTLAWVVVALIAMYFRKEIFEDRELFDADEWIKHAALFGILAALVVGHGLYALMTRRANPAPVE